MATVGPSDYPVVTEGSDDSVVTEEDPAVAAVDTVVTQLLPVVEEVVHVLVPLDSVVTEGDPAVSNENFVATRGGYSVNSITYASEEYVRKNSPGFELMFKASPPKWADMMPQEPGSLTNRRKNLVGERGILVVYHYHAVFPDRKPDVATRALQVIHAASDMMGDDFNVTEITLGQRHLRCEPNQS